jgi:hypothetical protein
MSRSQSYWYLLRAPLAVLPFVIACASNPTKPAESPSDNSEAVGSGNAGKSEGSGATNSADDGKKPSSDKSDDKAADDKASDDKTTGKKTAADGDDDKAPTDDSRTTANVAKVFKDNRKAFKKCYEDVRRTQQDLKGDILLKVLLDGDGKVKKAYIDEEESTIHNQKIADCMVKLAQSLTYPKSSKGLDKDFEYKFGFNNQAQ